MKERGIKINALIPLNMDDFMFNENCKTTYKQQLKERLAANFVGWQKDNEIFEREIEKVIKALRTDRDIFDVSPKKKL
jgi:hypothetical protein